MVPRSTETAAAGAGAGARIEVSRTSAARRKVAMEHNKQLNGEWKSYYRVVRPTRHPPGTQLIPRHPPGETTNGETGRRGDGFEIDGNQGRRQIVDAL